MGPPLPMPKKTTICLRTYHYTFMNPVVSSYAFGLFFGSLLPVRVSSILLEMSLQDILLNIVIRIGPILLNIVIRLLSLQDWTDMDEGWLYGEWETGPWWAFHTKVKDGSRELICHILCAANLCFIFLSILKLVSL